MRAGGQQQAPVEVSFQEVVEMLQNAHEESGAALGNTTSRTSLLQKEELVRALFERAQGDEAALLLLLRLLLPGEDRDRVYGMKTRRLLRVAAAALSKAGHSDAAVRLRRWSPMPHTSSFVRGALVCMPELPIASALASASSSAAASSIADVARFCDALTRVYQSQQPTREGEGGSAQRLLHMQVLETAQVECFLQQIVRAPSLSLDFHGWLLLIRILLKRVSLGVGLATVLAALPLPDGGAVFYARQRSLPALARATAQAAHGRVRPGSDSAEEPEQDEEEGARMGAGVRCGTPFRPMTGDALRSPYLLKWIFSREEKLRRPISPIEGRLVIVACTREGASQSAVAEASRWFVPLNGRNRMRMVNLEEDRALQVVSRRRHLLLLRDFKRTNLIHVGNAAGLVLHYSLSAEGNGLYLFLLRAVSDAMDSGVELADSAPSLLNVEEEGEGDGLGGAAAVMASRTTVLDRPVDAFRSLPMEEFLRRLIRAPSATSENESEIVLVGAGARRRKGGGAGHQRMQLVVAPRTVKRRQQRQKTKAATVATTASKLSTSSSKTNHQSLLATITGAKQIGGGDQRAKEATKIAQGVARRVIVTRQRQKEMDKAQNFSAGQVKERQAVVEEEEAASDLEDMEDDETEYTPTMAKRQTRQQQKKKKISLNTAKKVAAATTITPTTLATGKTAGIVAQVKYDGDRMQAHIWGRPTADGAPAPRRDDDRIRPLDVPAVRLFSKNGFDVSALYSDITRELQQALWRSESVGPLQCILDGELVVVDANGAPLPWDSEKWRYNNNHHNTSGGSSSSSSSNVDGSSNNTNPSNAAATQGNPSASVHGEGGRRRGLDEWTALSAASSSTSTSAGGEEEGILMLEYSETETSSGACWEDASEAIGVPEAVTFLPLGAVGHWGGEGARAGRSARLVERAGCRLQFVVFDVLMLRGEDLSGLGYRVRLARLEGEVRPALVGARHVRVIDNTRWISTASELVQLMREAVREGLEGYVLKDPDAPYAFERTSAVQKMKLAGPDVNVGVIGLGFSLSTNPRRWGIATGLRRAVLPVALAMMQTEEEEEPEGDRVVEYYCRTESFEGDRPHIAFENVYALSSRVRVRDVLQALSAASLGNRHTRQTKDGGAAGGGRVRAGGRSQYYRGQQPQPQPQSQPSLQEEQAAPGGVLEQALHRVFVREWADKEEEEEGGGAVVEVRWQARNQAAHGHHDGRVCFPKRVLSSSENDIEWLCSPWECPFSLSLRGDLRPLEGGVLRHPVARPEVVGRQVGAAVWDTRDTVRRKFEEAAAVSTCVERHTMTRLRRLRALPPTRQRLEEVGRTAMAWASSVIAEKRRGGQAATSVTAMADPGARAEKGQEEEKEEWPQLPPGAFVTLSGLSETIVRAGETLRVLLPEVGADPSMSADLRSALRKLSPEERLAMADLPSHSQWVALEKHGRGGVPTTAPRAPLLRRFGSEDDLVEAEADREKRHDLEVRLMELKAHLGQGLVIPSSSLPPVLLPRTESVFETNSSHASGNRRSSSCSTQTPEIMTGSSRCTEQTRQHTIAPVPLLLWCGEDEASDDSPVSPWEEEGGQEEEEKETRNGGNPPGRVWPFPI